MAKTFVVVGSGRKISAKHNKSGFRFILNTFHADAPSVFRITQWRPKGGGRGVELSQYHASLAIATGATIFSIYPTRMLCLELYILGKIDISSAILFLLLAVATAQDKPTGNPRFHAFPYPAEWYRACINLSFSFDDGVRRIRARGAQSY